MLQNEKTPGRSGTRRDRKGTGRLYDLSPPPSRPSCGFPEGMTREESRLLTLCWINQRVRGRIEGKQ